MKRPSSALVVDAAILVAAVRGRSSGVIRAAASTRILVTTDRAVQEAQRRIALGLKRPELLPVLAALVELIVVVPMNDYADSLPDCERMLKDGVNSRNGSTKDAHILALAQITDADIWSSDRDFAGTGMASWSTPNLARGLAAG